MYTDCKQKRKFSTTFCTHNLSFCLVFPAFINQPFQHCSDTTSPFPRGEGGGRGYTAAAVSSDSVAAEPPTSSYSRIISKPMQQI